MSIILIKNIQRHFETGSCRELLALTRITPCEKVSPKKNDNLQHINKRIILLDKYNQDILENKHRGFALKNKTNKYLLFMISFRYI